MRRYLRCPGAICCPARRALRAVLLPHTAVNALEHVRRPETQHPHVVIGNELAEADAGQRDAADEAKPRRVMLVVSATHRAAAS